MKEKLKKLSLLDSAAICAAIMLFIYAMKGVWPFGTGNICYDDMAQGAVPALYHLYDWIHGDKALDWDWLSGLGTNVANFGNPTPLLLVLCLFPRDSLLYAVGIYVVLKVSAAALTSKYCFTKMFPKPDGIWHTLFSVMYAMSAFSMFYYTNTSWLDFVVVFPFIIYGLKRLLDEDKPFMYIAAFAVTLFYSVYHGFMVTLAVFMLSGLYIVLISPKEKRGRQSVMLGLSTLAGGLLSCFAAVPAALQTLGSKRFETSTGSEEGVLEKILKAKPDAQLHNKLILLIGLQLAIVLTVVFIVKLFKDKKIKQAVFVLTSTLILLLPIFIESINLIWHMGSYVQFPTRFFFISVFVLLCFSLAGIEKYSEAIVTLKNKYGRFGLLILCAALTVGMLYGLIYFAENILGTIGTAPEEVISATDIKYTSFLLLFGFGIPLFAFLLFQKKYIIRSFCFVLCVIQCAGICYGGVANKHQQESEEFLYNSPSFLEYCAEVSSLDTDCGEMGRIKNADTNLNTNYPFVIGTPALSNWTHYISLAAQNTAKVLGYSVQYTRLLDSGGTAFTDGIIGVKKMIMRSHHKASSRYTLLDSTQNFNLYENGYAVEFGLLGNKELLDSIDEISVDERFEVQNKLWQIFTNSDEKLFDICTRTEDGENIKFVESTPDKLVFRYTAGKNEELYLNCGEYKKQSFKMSVNGERIMAPYHKYTEYLYYPSAAVNGTLLLGSFNEGEEVEVVVECINGQLFGDKTVQLASMSLDKMTELNSLYKDTITNERVGKSSLSFDYNNTTGESRYLFIPVTYDNGFNCKIDGKKAQIHCALGAYLAVELPEGSGKVEIDWQPEGEKPGIILTVFGILLTAFILLIKKRNISLPKFIEMAVFYGLAFACVAAVAVIHLVPIGYMIYDTISGGI